MLETLGDELDIVQTQEIRVRSWSPRLLQHPPLIRAEPELGTVGRFSNMPLQDIAGPDDSPKRYRNTNVLHDASGVVWTCSINNEIPIGR